MTYRNKTLNILISKITKHAVLLTIIVSVLTLGLTGIGVYYTCKQAMDTRVVDMLEDYRESSKSFVSVNVADSILQKYPVALQSRNLQKKIKLLNQYLDAIKIGNLREKNSDYTDVLRVLKALENIINKESEIREDWWLLSMSAIAENPKNTAVYVVNLSQLTNSQAAYAEYLTLFKNQESKICKYITDKNIRKAKKLLYDVLDSNEFCTYIIEMKNLNQNIFTYSNTILSEYAVNGKL